jgi:hypothetical protein
MDLKLDSVTVDNNEAAQRFETGIDGYRALLTYRRFPSLIVFNHMEVPQPLEGKGLGAKLARAALDFARANHLRVVPLCPYVASYIRKHSEYQDLLSPDDLQRVLSR